MRQILATLTACLCASIATGQAPDAPPRSLDPRLEIVRFAAAPDIVHPIACDFDAKGRLLVVESHTHFRPKGYNGPERDRIRIVEDTDGDGKADRFTSFHEGLKFTMDLAVHPIDGSVYVATRNEILRLRDTDGDGKADESTRLMFLETKGDYPHNGLSGLCFDFKGDFYFGLGENLGESYKLKGADGAVHTGGGEGGNIFWCTAGGKKLRRVATGFWNPFGVCRDVFGRIFAVDNDPDSMPPCRLVHVVEGGDYGYQFRYGRSGRHPFQAWNGELPGTLPYVVGVGEAPSEVLAYESDGLPRDYLGTLLVTAWADHRLECYPLEAKGASFTAKKKVVIQGGKDFRPVGLAVAPDGSLFMSDWVRRDYNLHGQGAVWQVRVKNAVAKKRPTELDKAVMSLHRPTREAAARALASDNINILDLSSIVKDGPLSQRVMRAWQLEAMGRGNAEPLTFGVIGPLRKSPPLDDPDPFTRLLAIRQVADSVNDKIRIFAVNRWLTSDSQSSQKSSAVRDEKKISEHVSLFLACRRANTAADRALIAGFLDSSIEDVRFLTAKWIADDVIKEAREPLEKAMKDPALNSRLYMAYATALARLDGRPVNENSLADSFLQRAKDEKAAPASRVFALRMVPASHKGLTTEQLVKWMTDPSPDLRLEAVRALNEQTGAKRSAALAAIVKDAADLALRREALTGLADRAEAELPLFLSLAAVDDGNSTPLSADALRGLVNVPLDNDAKFRLTRLAKFDPSLTQLVGRAIDRPVKQKKAPPADVDGWLKRLEGTADANAGRRIFFHPRLTNCARCHRVDGRGRDVGPDLSSIGQRDRRFIVESILFPSREVAPHFQTWHVETADGKVRTGLLWRTDLDKTTYIDEKGQPFDVLAGDIVEARPAPASIMPEGLIGQLTDGELRDLLAYLASRK
jgi:putative membrane-bound dehydrogenase-like protein